VEMEYLQTKEALRILKRELKLRRKKEKIEDAVQRKKKVIIGEILKHSPTVKLNIQGVVGEYAIVDGYVLPSGVKTPYGNVRVVGSTVLLGDSLVFPSVKPDYNEIKDYVTTIEGVPYYRNISTMSNTGSAPSSFVAPPP